MEPTPRKIRRWRPPTGDDDRCILVKFLLPGESEIFIVQKRNWIVVVVVI